MAHGLVQAARPLNGIACGSAGFAPVATLLVFAVATGLSAIVLHDGPHARWLDWRQVAFVVTAFLVAVPTLVLAW